MFIKNAKMKIESSSVIDRDMLLFGAQKKAFIKHDISNNLIHASNSLDIVAELKEREPSEWIIFRARAIDAGGSDKDNKIYHGANDNGDYFSEEELLSDYEKSGLKSYETFINVPLFTNHQNGDIEQARGKVIASFYDLDNHCVYTDCMIDGKAYPALARGIREGYINDVSMGMAHEDSEILMANGKTKKHKDIKIGDLVLTHTGQVQPVTMVGKTNESVEYYKIYTSNNKPLIVSYDHPVYLMRKHIYDYMVKNGGYTDPCNFVEARNIKDGDFVTTLSDNKLSTLKINKIEKLKSTSKDFFYHIEVGGNENPEIDKLSDHSYIADGIAVHNCSVKWSSCSACGNKAVVEADYCSCVKNHKGKTIQGQKVYEKNHGIKFIELSAVTDGACENCTIQNAYHGDEFLNKLKDNVSGIVLKACGNMKDSILSYKRATSTNLMIKTARGEDVDKLNKALDNLREVADQILNSKAVDFEFLEKIGSLLADLQELIVDLVEAGFANEAGAEAKETGAPAPNPAASPSPSPIPGTTNTPAPAAAQAAPVPAAMPSRQTQLIAKVENYKKAGKNISKDLEELLIANSKIKEIADGITVILQEKIAGGSGDMPTKKQLNRMSTSSAISEKFAEILDERLSQNDPIVISDGPYSIKIDPIDGISGFVDNTQVVEASNEELGEDLVVMAKINPQVVAGRLIQVLANKYNENGELKMTKGASSDNLIKEALITNAPPVKQVQEGQLGDLDGNFSRKNDAVKAEGQVGVTTEKQLDNVVKSKETGTGDWGRVRPDGVKEDKVVTEGQLDDAHPTNYGSERKHKSAAPATDQLGTVIEGQFKSYKDPLDGASAGRWHDESTPGDYKPITEAQFEGKDRLGKAVDELQEGQLETRRQGDGGFAGSTDASPHTASKEESIVTAIVNGFANAVLARRISPKSLVLAKAGLIAPKGNVSDYRFAGKTNWSVDEIRAVAQSSIVEELKSLVDFNDSDVEEALGAVYEAPETLEASISNSVQEKIADLSNIQDVETVEENKKASYMSALKKTAFMKESALIHLGPADLRNLLGGDFSFNKLKDTDLEAALSKLNPEADFFDFSKAADGGWNIRSTINANDLKLINQDGNTGLSNNVNGPSDNRLNHSNEHHNNVLDIPSMDSSNSPMNTNQESGMALSAAKIEALKKLAQSPAGTTMPAPGGAAPASPAAPAAGGGLESLTNNAPADESFGDDELGGDDEMDTDGEPKPFGSICPKCGSEDVDEIEGRSKCNNCALEFETEINIHILNEGGEEGEGDGDDFGDELEPTEGENINDELAAPAEQAGGAAPGGAGAPPPAGGAGGMGGMAHSNAWLRTSFKVDPTIFVKNSPFRFASVGKSVAPGHRCISCGTTRVAFKESNGVCLKCGNQYSVAVKKIGKDVVASIYWTPNLAMKDEPTIIEAANGEKINLGYATKGDVMSASDVKKVLHEILSSRDNMIKTANVAQNTGTFDDMMICQLDQCGRGYASGEARTICSSIKANFLAKKAEGNPFAEKDEEKDDNKGFGKDDSESDDDDDNVEFKKEDSNESDDSTSFDNDTDEDDDFGDDFDDGMEEIETDEDENINDVPGEFGGDSEAPKVQKIELYMTDKDGNDFEVEYDVSGIEPNTAEDPDDFNESPDQEVGFGDETNEFEDDSINEFSDDINDDGGEVVIEEEIDDPAFSIKDLFAPKDEFNDVPEHNVHEKKMPMNEYSVMNLASGTSELLRGDKVTSSNRSGGNNIDLDKVAQFLGITMPNNTGADVPRNKAQGIREDGEVVSTHDHPNTAKKMADGKHRGSAYTDPDQAIDRGVEVIDPKAGRHASAMKKKAEEDTIKPTPSGSKENHASPDGSDQTPNNNGEKNEERKGDGKVKEKSNASEPTPAGDDDNHASASSSSDIKEAAKNCAKCKKPMKKCSCSMTKKKTKIEEKKDKKKKAGSNDWMKVAQSNDRQSEPIDSISDKGKVDVPRDKAKSKPETKFERPKGVDNPIEVRKKDYGFGEKGKNLHTEVVPRDGSGDGLGGKSVSFEKEKGEDVTSGNPDTYVQDFQKNEKPTPAGNEDNHGTLGPNTAKDRVKIRKIAVKTCKSCGAERCDCGACDCKGNTECTCN